jgi:hypothetical protein
VNGARTAGVGRSRAAEHSRPTAGMKRKTALPLAVCGMALVVLSAGCARNRPPTTPVITGPSTGEIGNTLTFAFSATDPDNQELEYMVAWGDTSAVEWSAPYPSGQSVTRTHVYADSGVYHVKVKARDTRQTESGWSDSLSVAIAPEPGGPPLNLRLEADTDSSITVLWEPPQPQSQCIYQVYFKDVRDSAYALLATTASTLSKHIPPLGATGWYKVAAKFGNTVYESPTVLSTVPVHTSVSALAELNADPSLAGYGWDRNSGVGGLFAMTDSANCSHVDFYVSDLRAGVGNPMEVVSPSKADSMDAGAVGIVPQAAWRLAGFSDPLSDPQAPLPGYHPPPNANYFIYTQVTTQPCYISCYTAGDALKHFALIQVDSVDVPSGQMWVQSWYQLVPGLRLIRH